MNELHIFLSYCHDNKSEVEVLRDNLINQGFGVWWDGKLSPGQNWKNEIGLAIRTSGAVIACFSKEVQNRVVSGLFPELHDAIECYRQLQPGSVYLIPVRLSECRIPDVSINATTNLSDLQYVDLFPNDKYEDGMEKLVSALSLCPQLKRSETTVAPSLQEVQSIAQRAFRAGRDVNPIDTAITVIVFKGAKDKVQSALSFLENSFDTRLSAYDHGDELYEVIIPAPVSSRQISILADRNGIGVKSIDHVPEPFYSNFIADLKKYLESEECDLRRQKESENREEDS